jgi:Lysyl oxidase
MGKRMSRLLSAAATAALVAGLSSGAVVSAQGGTGPAPLIGARGEEDPVLLPNARPLRAADLSISGRSDGRRVLRFESGLANTGRSVLQVHPDGTEGCPRGEQHASQILFRDADDDGWYDRGLDTQRVVHDAGCMVFHPTHSHWHFEAAARYALWDPHRASRPLLVQGRKMSFCLRDTERVPERWQPSRRYDDYYGDCSQHTPQGISVGWVDIYGSYLPGQSLTLPRRLPTGLYCLRTTVDPRNYLRESDDTDNHSLRAVRISGTQVRAKPSTRCAGIPR